MDRWTPLIRAVRAAAVRGLKATRAGTVRGLDQLVGKVSEDGRLARLAGWSGRGYVSTHEDVLRAAQGAVFRSLARAFRGTGTFSRRFMVAHGLFAVVLAGAVWIRVITVRGYPSVLWSGDSWGYLNSAVTFTPSDRRPSGYSILLWMLRPLHDFTAVVSIQHALGVLTGVLVYALVWRAGRARWRRRLWLPGIPASLATVPVLYDGNQIQLEHLMLSDELFTFLLVAAVTVAMWRNRPSLWTAGPAGALLACAAVTRSAGLPLLLVLLVWVLVRWSGWRRTVPVLVAAVVGFAVPVGAYLNWFHSHHGVYAFTETDQIWLYGRTAAFADCAKIKPPPDLAVMCPRHPASDPRIAPAFAALWTKDSPFSWMPQGPTTPGANELAGRFARAAIIAQPGDYARVVWRDTFRSFEGGPRKPYPTPWTIQNLTFPVGEAWKDEQALLATPYGGRTAPTRVVEPDASWIRDYQARWYLPGPWLGFLFAVGLAGMLLRVRRFGGAPLLPWATAAALLVIPAATADFDYRYVLPAIPFACLAAALAVIPAPRRTEPVPEVRPPADSEPDEFPEARPADGHPDEDATPVAVS